jgi:type II secretory pathway pseudopilin PulG
MYGIEMLLIVTLIIFGFGILYAVPMYLGARREQKREEKAARSKTVKPRR